MTKARQESRWPKVSGRLVVITTLGLIAIGLSISHHRATSHEVSALEFVRLFGTTSHGYRHNALTALSTQIPLPFVRMTPSTPVAGVHIPRDRLNDRMAEQLLRIRNLETLALYPPNLNSMRLNPAATSITTSKTLRGHGLPLSSQSVAQLESQHPNLTVYFYDVPAPTSANSDITHKDLTSRVRTEVAE